MQGWRAETSVCIFCAFKRYTTPVRAITYGTTRFQSNHTATRDDTARYFRIVPSQGKSRRKSNRDEAHDGYAPMYRRGIGGRLSRGPINPLKQELMKRDPTLLFRSVRSTMTEIKSHLKTKSFGGSGILRQCSILDPDMKYFPSFMRRVMAAFDPGFSLNRERPLEKATIEACKTAFTRVSGQSIRSILIDAYVHHIVVRLGYDDDHEKKSRLLDILKHPTEFYPGARAIQRQIHLHVGPTNSGKTYNALKKLEGAECGFYAGPLRLLAQEVYSRFNSKGIDCGLVTGDEVKGMTNWPKITSHTVEMTPLSESYDVGVIDEIQMMGSKDRGWAWTQAFLGARAKELHLCGEERVVPLIQELTASMGDTLHIHRYERLNPLKAMSSSLKGDLKNLRRGDCVVCFSILNLHAMKQDIERITGRNCAIVYGSLPPEIRAQQARLFNDPDNTYDYLVASDAIGMGLNLSIKRIIFETVYKYNGTNVELLDVSSLKQIAGRAGRYRSAHEDTIQSSAPGASTDSVQSTRRNLGLVTCLHDEDLSYVQTAMERTPEPLEAAGIHPPSEVIALFAAKLPEATPFTYVINRTWNVLDTNKRFFLCDPSEPTTISRMIEDIEGLSIQDRYTFCRSPAPTRETGSTEIVRELATCVGSQKLGHLLDLKTMPLEVLDRPFRGNKKALQDLGILHRGLTLYIWLSYRFGSIFESRYLAEHTKTLVERNMDQILTDLSVDPHIREAIHRMKAKNRERFTMENEAQLKDIIGEQRVADSPPAIPMNDWIQPQLSAESVMDSPTSSQNAEGASL